MPKPAAKEPAVAERRRRMRRRGLELELQSLFGPPPILDTEDEIAFYDLADQIRAAIAPRDMIEHMLARDVADLHWEALRLRRAKTSMVRTNRERGVELLLRRYAPAVASELRDNPGQDPRVLEALLKDSNLDMDDAHAETLICRLDDIERLDRLIVRLEVRRNNVLRELDRRREAQARRARPTPGALIEAFATPAEAPE